MIVTLRFLAACSVLCIAGCGGAGTSVESPKELAPPPTAPPQGGPAAQAGPTAQGGPASGTLSGPKLALPPR